MKLEFDSKGYLTPYKRIQLSLKQFEELFVVQFDSESSRSEIFKSYRRFIADFKSEVTSNFVHWVNGSFVSKKPNPKDIDFVTLIEHDTYKENRDLIDNKFRLKKAKEIYSVDAYTIELYPEGHSKHSISKIDLVYWDNWFSKTKKNWAKKTFPKGYVEIHFT